ncbi:XRE family transcriptional regulator [Nordella sp. HKS 07]|uniref:helix-turn-helix domain-containing protein n=1 Tax=Nordella sp. HKS 07 TaxID=2712222 RepID=UPI0013E1E649|nr:helix-turn-helix transcriptional regulator [Nordella sp. HKS 07]QIG51053.1 XRE family transcriptional regulator [Nordella sp. HKS 07]
MAHITRGSVWYAIEKDPIAAAAMECKSKVLIMVQKKLKEKGWTQAEAAKHLKTDQPRISDLMNGNISNFSIDMLLGFLDRLGRPA